jgi:hypothetical protein
MFKNITFWPTLSFDFFIMQKQHFKSVDKDIFKGSNKTIIVSISIPQVSWAQVKQGVGQLISHFL